jgi:serine/threonine protein kinase
MPLTSGTRLGSYEVIGPLGAGGMGEVYRGRDTRLKREVAIKVLPEALAQDPDALARFRREAELLATLNHKPGVLPRRPIDRLRSAGRQRAEAYRGDRRGRRHDLPGRRGTRAELGA